MSGPLHFPPELFPPLDDAMFHRLGGANPFRIRWFQGSCQEKGLRRQEASLLWHQLCTFNKVDGDERNVRGEPSAQRSNASCIRRYTKQGNGQEQAVTNILKTLIPDEEAATALEYALLLFLIAGVIIGAVSVFGVSVGDLFKTAGAAIGAVMG